jgi:hypothetical protein
MVDTILFLFEMLYKLILSIVGSSCDRCSHLFWHFISFVFYGHQLRRPLPLLFLYIKRENIYKLQGP